MTRIWLVSGLMVGVLISLVLIAGEASAQSEEDRRKIVLFVPGTPLFLQQTIIQTLAPGSEIVHTLTLITALAIRLPLLPLDELQAIVDALELNVLVAGVYPDIVGSAAENTPVTMEDILGDSPREGSDWGVIRVGATTLRETEPGSDGSGVTVAVLDTGINCGHPDLQANILLPGFTAFPKTDPCNDDHGHGTHIAGTIAARQNEQGLIGVAPEAKVTPVKVLDRNAKGRASDVIAALQWVHKQWVTKGRYKLVNMSLGFPQNSYPLQRAIDKLSEKQIIIVASAGNRCPPTDPGGGGGGGNAEGGGGDEGGGDGDECLSPTDDDSTTGVTYPAGYSSVISVGAMTRDEQVAEYSRVGKVNVLAPGGAIASDQILSTVPGTDPGYGRKCGTSMAAAHATGTLAVVLQRQPSLTIQGVVDLLRSTAQPLPGYSSEEQGEGVIDVREMVYALQ